MSVPVIGQPGPEQYGYKAFVGGKEYDVWAKGLFAAKQAVIAYAKVPKSKQDSIGIVVCERPDGSPIIHSGAEF